MKVGEIRPQTKTTIKVICVAAIALIFLGASGWFGGYRINTSPSYPMGLWRIRPISRSVRVGDHVFICPPKTAVFISARERGYLRPGLCPGGFGPLIKIVAATAGQRVEINESVAIDGRHLAHSHLADVDGKRRPLSRFAGGVVPPNFLFLHSDFVGSYDSRYFGPVPKNGVLGLATEVITCGP